MNVPGPGAQVLRVATPATELRRRGVELAVGARVEAQILVVNGDHAVIGINGQTIAASTATPLREGQRVQLQVDRADDDALVLRLVDSAPGRPAPRELPPGAILPRTPEDIARAIRAIGLPVDETTLLAADALLSQGLPLSQANMGFVTRNLPRFRLEPSRAAEALAITRSLNLPASDDVVTLIAAAREAGTMPLAERLDAVTALAAQVRQAAPEVPSGSLPGPADASTALIAALRDVLTSVQQIGRVGGAGEVDALIAARLSAMLAAMEFGGLLDVGARLTGEIADLLNRMPMAAMGDIGRSVSTPLAQLAGALEKEIASLLGFLTGTGAPSTSATRLGELTASVAQVLAGSGIAEGAVAPQMTHAQAEQLVVSLRRAVEGFSAALSQDPRANVPLSLRTQMNALSDLPARLLGRLGSASAAIEAELPPEAAAEVSRLSSELQAVVLGATRHPADRIAQLAAAVAQATAALEPAAVRSPTVRVLLPQLLGVAEQLSSPSASAEPERVLDAAVMRLASALQAFRGTAQARLVGFAATLQSRLYADIALTASRMAASLSRYAADAFPQVQTPTTPALAELAAALPPNELSALHYAANQAIRNAGEAVREFMTAIRSSLAQRSGPTVEPLLQAVDEAVAQPVRPAEVPRLALPQLEALGADRAAAQRLGPVVAAAVRSLRPAETFQATRDLAAGAAQLAQSLESTSIHPTAPTGPLADELRAAVETLGRSLENRLLTGDPARAADRDLRAALVRVERALERLVEGQRTSAASSPAPAELLSAVASLRQVVEGQQLLNAQSPRPTVPSHIYVQVPVVVDGRRLEAHIKVQRDGDGATQQIDEDNARIALRLNTDNLGTVTALLSMDLGRLSVDLSLDDTEALEFVRAHIEELDAALEQTGLPVDRLMAMGRRPQEPDDFDRLGEPAYEPYTLSILA